MLKAFAALLGTTAGRIAFARIAGALAVTAVGSGILMSVWAHALVTHDYVPRTELVEVFARYLRGEPSAVWVVVVAGPLGEEIVARGLLLTVLLWFYRPTVAIGLSALVFGAAHLNLLQLLPGMLMGVILGAVYARTGSLTLCWLGHAFYNAQYWLAHSVFALPIAGYSALPPVGRVGDQPPAWLLLGVVLLVGGSIGLRWALGTVPPSERPTWRSAANAAQSHVSTAGASSPLPANERCS